MTDIILLATLLTGPQHGYQLKHQAGLILGQSTLHNNSVYPLLRRFVKEGWVVRKTVSGDTGHERHLYALTIAGKKALIEKLKNFSGAEVRSSEAFLARVGMFGTLDPDSRERVMAARALHLRGILEHLRGIKKKFPLDCYAQATVDFLRKQTQAELAWIRHLHTFAINQSIGGKES